MGLMDGAVKGMVSRLIQAGFTPSESFCLAQVAYVKEHKREASTPRAVLDRKAATWEINQTLGMLGMFPMGSEAHRQRIILWDKIFGRGSWHEPIDPEEIYGPPYTTASSSPNPASAFEPVRRPSERKEFSFVLPGQTGQYSEAYAETLVKAAETELRSQASASGYSIDSRTVQVEIVDVDHMRRQGHDMKAVGIGDNTYLAAYVTGEGIK